MQQPSAAYRALPASAYSYQQLADIYNRSRVDYIVPMPMNARRMEEYIRHYDIDLDLSVVSLNDGDQVAGIGMLGRRDSRAWVTRLGVIPEQRGHRLGQFLMERLLVGARDSGARLAQLEVIAGNEPAHRLFLKFGFNETRELLVVRRPPGAPTFDLPPYTAEPLSVQAIHDCLRQRSPAAASWIDETPSLLQAGSLDGLRAVVGSVEGWLVCRNTQFQLSHLVLDAPPDAAHEVALALLDSLHRAHPRQDTKLENLPALSPVWPAYQAHGYREVFRRIEMTLPLA